MNVNDCMKYTLEVLKFGGLDWLAIRIGEAYEKHMRNEKLTKQDTFVLGLRYSEFLATDTTDESYCLAEKKRVICLQKLGLTVNQVNNAVYNVTGLA